MRNYTVDCMGIDDDGLYYILDRDGDEKRFFTLGGAEREARRLNDNRASTDIVFFANLRSM
jgi:hypothetical protein